jgi:hypothetical protein
MHQQTIAATSDGAIANNNTVAANSLTEAIRNPFRAM